MQLLEHVAKAIAAKAGIPIPSGEVAATPDEAQAIAEEIGGRVAVKAQVPIGGRGRDGGILIVEDAEAGHAAERLLGSTVRGFRVDSVLVEEAIEVVQELYLGVAIRPARREVVLILSSAGGVDVEAQASEHAGVVSIPIPSGLRPWHVWRAASRADISSALVPALIDYARRAHALFWQERAELVEINPLFVTPTGGLMAGDVRIIPDPEADLGDDEALAPELQFDFVVLNPQGRVGLVTTGAGGSMHLIDRLAEAGLEPIDFCDLRTGRPRGLAERLTTAFRRLDEMPNLSCIAVNFFAGVTILDEVTPVLVEVIRAAASRVPIVARVEGRGAEAARASLTRIGARCATSLDELVDLVGKADARGLSPQPPLRVGDGEPAYRAGAMQERAIHRAPISLEPAGPRLSTPARTGTADPSERDPSNPPDQTAGWGAASDVASRLPPLRRGEGRDAGGEAHRLPVLWTLLDQATTGVIVQGMTGQIGRRHTSRMQAYGTPIVAGVTPGRGGTVVDGVPVFNTVADAVDATGARASIAFLPAEVAPDGIVEAAEAGVALIVCPTEGMRLHNTLRALDAAQRHGTRVVGPNTGGLLVPGKLSLGFLPADFARPGPCAVLSRSGTLSYESVLALANVGLGVSVWIGVGGDRMKGSTFADLLPDLLHDSRTGAVVILGEIGGTDEEDAAAILAGSDVPAVALLAGRTAPAGVSMGHAGAIVDGTRGSYESKRDALLAAGVAVAQSPSEMAAILRLRLPALM
jgi:succinyl-CoA synthetase alpha subunit/succinyl-CoA synthetase beta subunit